MPNRDHSADRIFAGVVTGAITFAILFGFASAVFAWIILIPYWIVICHYALGLGLLSLVYSVPVGALLGWIFGFFISLFGIFVGGITGALFGLIVSLPSFFAENRLIRFILGASIGALLFSLLGVFYVDYSKCIPPNHFAGAFWGLVLGLLAGVIYSRFIKQDRLVGLLLGAVCGLCSSFFVETLREPGTKREWSLAFLHVYGVIDNTLFSISVHGLLFFAICGIILYCIIMYSDISEMEPFDDFRRYLSEFPWNCLGCLFFLGLCFSVIYAVVTNYEHDILEVLYKKRFFSSIRFFGVLGFILGFINQVGGEISSDDTSKETNPPTK